MLVILQTRYFRDDRKNYFVCLLSYIPELEYLQGQMPIYHSCYLLLAASTAKIPSLPDANHAETRPTAAVYKLIMGMHTRAVFVSASCTTHAHSGCL